MTFTTLIITSQIMGDIASCIPINHPRKVMSDKVAGAAQIRIKKYFRAKISTSGEQETHANTAVTNNHCIAQTSIVPKADKARLCANNFEHSVLSCRPKACAVIPEVPTLKKPKFQYNKSNSIVPIAIPPIADASDIWPMIAVSTRPTSGIVILARILGTAKRNICAFVLLNQSSSN